MVNFDKYEYTGWGLCRTALMVLYELIKKENIKNVLEFGSGQSSYFIKDLELNLTSFDDNPYYAALLPEVTIRDLVQLPDNLFTEVINGEISYLSICDTLPVAEEKSTKQRNLFYNLKDEDIADNYDLIILDGANGNGRSIAFNVIKEKVNNNPFIFIDDYDHYPFIENMLKLFPDAKLIKSYNSNRNRNSFQIYKLNG
jgi:hypothetical protein